MSGNLAIAAVSAVMKYLLLNPSAGNSISTVVPDLKITAIPPHQVKDNPPNINIFFYRASANNGWLNEGLPARNSQGERQNNPFLALDLYYLITAHADRDYLGEVLMGFSMQTFHENPVLPRETIRTALSSASLVTSNTPANVLQAFAAADLAEQIEQIKITPHFPPAEEMSNLWSSMSSGYVPTAYYKVSVVLIESKQSTRTPLPVRAYNIYALPFKQPRIADVISQTGAGLPILAGSGVLLRGSALRGDNTQVIIGGAQLSGAALTVSDEQIALNLPSDLKAGIIGAQVAHLLDIGTPPTLHQGIESNVAAFILQPQITKTGPNYNIQIMPAAGSTPRRLRITIKPAVGADQRASVLLNERNAPNTRPAFSFSFLAPPRPPASPPAAQLIFPISGVPAGTYLVRVHIDGAESPLDYVDPSGFILPAVVLP